jgi:hypothetical protein
MAGWASTGMADSILDFFYRGTAITIGADLWIRLLVSPSSRSGGGTETNYGDYARFQFARGTALFGVAPSGGQLTNSVEFAFPSPTTVGNGDLVWFDIVDTASGAVNKIYHGGPIQPADKVEIGKPPTYPAGKLLMTV